MAGKHPFQGSPPGERILVESKMRVRQREGNSFLMTFGRQFCTESTTLNDSSFAVGTRNCCVSLAGAGRGFHLLYRLLCWTDMYFLVCGSPSNST